MENEHLNRRENTKGSKAPRGQGRRSRRRDEATLRGNEQKYRIVVENANEGISVAQDGTLRFVNRKMKEILGYSEEELMSRPFVDFIYADDQERVLANYFKSLGSESLPEVYPFRVVRKDGQTRWVMIKSVGILWEGKPATLNFFVDITENRRGEEFLRASEEKFRNLIETTNDLVWESDEHSVLTYVSPRVHDVLGYTVDEMLGKTLYDFMPPGEKNRLVEISANLVTQRQTFERFENIILDKEGRLVVLETSGTPFFDPYGKFRGYRGISRDITERKAVEEELRNYRHCLEELIEERTLQLMKVNDQLLQEINEHRKTEEALRESEKRYREIVDTTLEGVCVVDGEGRILYVNQRITEMIGHTPGELLGQPFFDFMEEPTRSEAQRKLELSREGFKDQYDFCFKTREGGDLWTIISSNPMFDDRRQWIGTLLMITDITERKSIEGKIHRSKMMLQRLFDGISEPLFMIDRSLNVAMLNVTARDYCGAGWNEIIGRPYDQAIMDGGSLDGFDIRSAFAQGLEFTFERKSPRDPNRFEKVVIYPLREETGEIGNVIIRISDITGERILQRQLLQNERLAALGLLVSGIAHEINNPNNFISFNIPILREFLEEIMPIVDVYAQVHPGYEVSGGPYQEFREEIFKLLRNIEHGAERINTTVSNLKEFSVSKEGQELTWIDPRGVIEKAVAMCQGELFRKVKFFDVEIADPLPRILTDAGALEQVVVNLLINACQAMDKEDSRLSINVFHGAGREHLVVEVSDNGCGMDERTVEKVFEPFFSTKKPGAGTGLGLYVSRNLIERLGGEIVVKSQAGEGTTFKVTLPELEAPSHKVQESY